MRAMDMTSNKIIIILFSVFSAIIVSSLTLASVAYQFVYCQNPVTGMVLTYPEGTVCNDWTEEEESDEEEEEEEGEREENDD